MSKSKQAKPRNPFHDHPLMTKGGVHEKTHKQKRKGEKQKWKKEWCSLISVKTMIKEHRSKTWDCNLMVRVPDCRSER